MLLKCWRKGLLVIFLLSLYLMSFASIPKIQVYNDKEDFEDAELKNIAIASPGYLVLSPTIISFFDSAEPFLWSWTKDSKGNIYGGTGNEGKVFKITPQKESSVFFDADELEIYSLATDKKDNIYVATSPEGKIYQITPGGTAKVLFDPPDKYIWDLEFNQQGNLFASTGDSCRIYKISPSGKGEVFFKSNDSHIEVILFNQKNQLIAGSVDNGYIYAIETSGKARVLFDSGYREVHSLAIAADGSIYAGVYGQKRPERLPQIRTKTPVKKKSEDGDEEEPVTELEEITIVADRPTIIKPGQESQEKSAVIKLTPEGAQQNIWRLNETVYSIVLNQDASLLVGTGGVTGKLYHLDQNEAETLLLSLDEGQITALHRDNENHVFMCTSNMGKIFEISQNYKNEGSYLSKELDAGMVADWGVIRWTAEIPSGTKVQFFTRTGNTENANETWSDWSGPYTKADGEAIQNPPAQFLQWKAVLNTSKEQNSPKIKEVAISFLQKNVSPVIRQIIINDPEEAQESNDSLTDEYYQEEREQEQSSRVVKSLIDARRVKRRMIRTARWSAEDENRDILTFDLFYKNVDEDNWKELSKDLKQKYFRWNSEKWPDGLYHLKIKVSDHASTPANLAKNSEKISEVFVADNSGPLVKNFNTKSTASTGSELTFTIQDKWSTIYHTEYVIDNGEWEAIFPIDGISDSQVEDFSLKPGKLTPGSHSLVIRVYDRFLNVGFGKFRFKIE